MPRSAQVLIVALILAGLAANPGSYSHAAAPGQECPTGTVPVPVNRMGDLFLPGGAAPYSIVRIVRYVLEPRETLTTPQQEPVMYIVESGELQVPRQSWASITMTLPCMPQVQPVTAIADSGDISSHGSISISEDDQIIVAAGQSIVAEHGLEGPLRNGGREPLVVLQVRIIEPDIDPESGLPIVDSRTAARERDREFALRRRSCRERVRAQAKGTPVPPLPAYPVYIDPPTPTPAFTVAGETKGEHNRDKQPRACEAG